MDINLIQQFADMYLTTPIMGNIKQPFNRSKILPLTQECADRYACCEYSNICPTRHNYKAHPTPAKIDHIIHSEYKINYRLPADVQAFYNCFPNGATFNTGAAMVIDSTQPNMTLSDVTVRSVGRAHS